MNTLSLPTVVGVFLSCATPGRRDDVSAMLVVIQSQYLSLHFYHLHMYSHPRFDTNLLEAMLRTHAMWPNVSAALHGHVQPGACMRIFFSGAHAQKGEAVHPRKISWVVAEKNMRGQARDGQAHLQSPSDELRRGTRDTGRCALACRSGWLARARSLVTSTLRVKAVNLRYQRHNPLRARMTRCCRVTRTRPSA